MYLTIVLDLCLEVFMMFRYVYRNKFDAYPCVSYFCPCVYVLTLDVWLASANDRCVAAGLSCSLPRLRSSDCDRASVCENSPAAASACQEEMLRQSKRSVCRKWIKCKHNFTAATSNRNWVQKKHFPKAKPLMQEAGTIVTMHIFVVCEKL